MDKQRVQKVLNYALTCTRSTGSEESQQIAVSTGNDSNTPSENGSEVYVFPDNTRREISNELVMKFPGSYFSKLPTVDSRTSGSEIHVDLKLKYLDEILKYMNNEYDVSELYGNDFLDFCEELMTLQLKFRNDISKRLFSGSYKRDIDTKKKCVIVNGTEYPLLFDHMKVRDYEYNKESDRYEMIRNVKEEESLISNKESSSEQFIHITDILNDFETYLKDSSNYVKNEALDIDDIIDGFAKVGIDTSDEMVKQYLLNYTCSLFCYGTKVLENSDYDDKLREWCGDFKWKLIYRASDHKYFVDSFHEYCDDKGPKLIVIKSSEGWIFGGYTTQSWCGECMYYDMIIINRSKER